ncbi:MAG: hypothetical protein WCK02_03955 [Bacteroidota bacterium]
MKYKYSILIILFVFLSCKNSNKKLTDEKPPAKMEKADEKSHVELHDEMDKVDKEFYKFMRILIILYKQADINPKRVIIKADSLLIINEKEKDPIKSRIKNSISNSLHYLKAELYYKIGDHKKSIKELETKNYVGDDIAVALASNYIKLKQFDKAKLFIDSVGKGYYIYDYVLGNYYESIGKRNKALKIYKEIEKDKSIKHYAHYSLAIGRIIELEKSNSILLNEIYFPTGNPNFEICKNDNENRDKIFEIIGELAEVKNSNENASIWIYESPQENDQNYYWIKVGEGEFNKKFKTKFNFFVFINSFEIKYYDENNKKVISLNEWRKIK